MKTNEIKQALQGLPRGAIVTLAARAALRGLLNLVPIENESVTTLAYWSEQERSTHLLALFEACNVGMLWVLGAADSIGVSAAREAASAAHSAATKARVFAEAANKILIDTAAEGARTKAYVAAGKAAKSSAYATAFTAAYNAAYSTAYIANPAVAAYLVAAQVASATVGAANAADNTEFISFDIDFAELVESDFDSDKSDESGVASDESAVDDATYAYTEALGAAVVAVFHAINVNPVIEVEFASDLMLIKKSRYKPFQSPMWVSISQIELQQRFDALKEVINSLGSGFDYWLSWLADRYAGEPMDISLQVASTRIPEAVRTYGAAAINAYLTNLKHGVATAPLNRVRAIFIGYGDAGKTSLVRVLHREAVVANEPMTPGIDIREWDVPGTQIKAHFWDFGGQVMAHATHQLFLRESCLYVLVVSSRSEINATEQAEYWLEHVKSFGKGSPVMIVGNKIDQTGLNLNMGALTQKYPQIVGFFPISCTQAGGAYSAQFSVFKQAFAQQLQKVGTHQMMFTPAQFQVLQRLRELTAQSSFLKHEDFDLLCSKSGVPETGEQNRQWLLDILDKLGVIVHFPQLKYMDEYVLNPRWLTYGVYTLMYSNRAHLSDSDVIHILGRKQVTDEIGQTLTYPPKRCGLIMDAMHEFKLCYSLPGMRETLIIPALLPPDAPQFSFEKTRSLAFAFEFSSFLPRHVLPELIVNRHLEIVSQTVWQHGVLLKHGRLSAQALLEVDYHLRALSIWVVGVEARDYLLLLREDIHTILMRLDIDFEESLALPFSARIKPDQAGHVGIERVAYKQILAYDQQGVAEYISKAGIRYDVGKVLLGYVSERNLEKERNQFIVNINGSRLGNVTVAELIDHSFNQQAKTSGSVVLEELGFWVELGRVFRKHNPLKNN
jgi:small GTP-binding protein